MIKELFQIIFSRKEKRTVNAQSDSAPAESHIFNFEFAKKYIYGKTVLDVGCWTGQFEELAIKVTKKIVGIDPDENAIKFAKHKIPKVTFLKGDATNLHFKNGSFDAVTFLDVIEHIPTGTELICLQQIYKVLKANGTLILSTNYKHPLAILLDPAFWAYGHRHYSKNELKGLLAKSGFTVDKMITVGGLIRILSHDISLLVKHILRMNIKYPAVIRKKISEDIKHGGIMAIYIVAHKN